MLAGTTDDLQVTVWDLTSGAVVARFPGDRAGHIYLVPCLVVCCAWCLLWVGSGVHLTQTRPWLDLIVVSGLTLTDAETAAPECGPTHGSRWQMPLSDLLLFIASIALLLAVTRFVVAIPVGTELVAFTTAFGVGLATTAFAAIWAALSRRQWVVRLVLLCFVAAVSGTVHQLLDAVLYSRYRLGWGLQTECGLAALAVLLSFSILRLHGYHLSHRAR
jgi:hypothetical protein